MSLPERIEHKEDKVIKFPNKQNIKPIDQLKKCTKLTKCGRLKQTPCNSKKGVPHEVYPIKDKLDIKKMKQYFQTQIDNAEYESSKKIACRNLLMFTLGINLGLRFSDLLSLTWGDIFNFDKSFKSGIRRPEKKTGKFKDFFLNQSCKDAITKYIEQVNPNTQYDFHVFISSEGGAIEVRTAGKILKSAAKECGFQFNFGTHSLRKTWAYHQIMAHKEDAYFMAHLMRLLNHSSIAATLHYAGLTREQDEQYYNDVNL